MCTNKAMCVRVCGVCAPCERACVIEKDYFILFSSTGSARAPPPPRVSDRIPCRTGARARAKRFPLGTLGSRVSRAKAMRGVGRCAARYFRPETTNNTPCSVEAVADTF